MAVVSADVAAFRCMLSDETTDDVTSLTGGAAGATSPCCFGGSDSARREDERAELFSPPHRAEAIGTCPGVSAASFPVVHSSSPGEEEDDLYVNHI